MGRKHNMVSSLKTKDWVVRKKDDNKQTHIARKNLQGMEEDVLKTKKHSSVHPPEKLIKKRPSQIT